MEDSNNANGWVYVSMPRGNRSPRRPYWHSIQTPDDVKIQLANSVMELQFIKAAQEVGRIDLDHMTYSKIEDALLCLTEAFEMI